MQPTLSYRRDIDGLRAIAVLSVIGFHTFPEWLPGGFLGVDIFFVISGYLISSYLFREGGFRFADFYARRIRRIFPALACVLAASFAYGWFALPPDEFARLGKHIAAGAGFVPNLALWREVDYFDSEAITKPLLHLWSLGIEEQFYIVWPLLVWLAFRFRLSLVILVGGVACASFVAAWFHDEAGQFYSPASRAWEIALGGIVAYASMRRGVVLANPSFAWLGLAAIALGIGLIGEENVSPAALLVPTVGTALLLISHPQSWPQRRLLSVRSLVWMGLISYPLYLWHWPLLSFATLEYSATPPLAVLLALIPAAIALAALTYYAVERPIRFGRAGKARAIVMLCLTLTALGCLGLFTFTQQGFAFRWTQKGAYLSVNQKQEQRKQRKERQAGLRSHSCHLKGDRFSNYLKHQDKCLKKAASKKNILIMGDSHAADLYAAFSHAYPRLHFLQATGAGCSLSGRDSRACSQLMRHAADFARKNPLDAVIIAVRWRTVSAKGLTRLQSLVESIKPSGAQVIIMGPPLEFTTGIRAILSRMPAGSDPNRHVQRYVRDSTQKSQSLARFAEKNGLHYIDRIREYCGTEKMCKVTNYQKLYILDYGHLTPQGAAYYGKKSRRAGNLERILKSPRGQAVTPSSAPPVPPPGPKAN